MIEHATLKQLSETFVLEVSGVDLVSDLNDTLVRSLQELLAKYLVLVIRDQHIDTEKQQIITEALGRRRDQSLHVWAPPVERDAGVEKLGSLGQLPLINNGNQLLFVNGPGLCDADHDPSVIEDIDDLYKALGTSAWHTGDTEKMNVEVVNILYPEIIPERKGETQFANTTAAFAALEPAFQEYLEGLRVLHCTVFPEVDFVKMPENTNPVNQPLVKQHAFTKEKFLYLNFNDMDRIVGFEREQSNALIKQLFECVVRPPFLYSHKWLPGDLVIWNCNGTLHRKVQIDPTCKRALRRTQVEIDILQSNRDWDRTREVTEDEHNGEYWHPYKFKPESSVETSL